MRGSGLIACVTPSPPSFARGAGLVEIGQLLRHQDFDDDAIYAKVDRQALRALALPWPGSAAMSPLATRLDDYLAMRRALGYKLRARPRAAAVRRVPRGARRGDDHHRAGARVRDASQRSEPVVWWHERLAIVRGFARYLQAFDPACEVPPTDLLPATFRRAIPYLFSEAEIEALMRRRRDDCAAASRRQLRGADRAVGGHRHARSGGVRA